MRTKWNENMGSLLDSKGRQLLHVWREALNPFRVQKMDPEKQLQMALSSHFSHFHSQKASYVCSNVEELKHTRYK